jgi:pyridoxamine 5'-phosphate oxidase
MNLETLRREYAFEGLDERDVDANPFKQFERWFQQAVDAEIELADVMTLATATKAGMPSARMVVLRGVDERGFVFYTDYRSAKSRELAENPNAALVFFLA